MSDYKIELYLYEVTSEFEKQVFAGILKAVGEEENFSITVRNETPVDEADRYDKMTADSDRFIREYKANKDVSGD